MTIPDVGRKLYRRTLAYMVMLGVFLLAVQWFPDVVLGVVLHPAVLLGSYTVRTALKPFPGRKGTFRP